MAGSQKKHFKDTLKASLKDFSINVNSWEALVQERSTWHNHISTGADSAEKQRTLAAIKKWEQRSARSSSEQLLHPSHWCPCCGRSFTVQIGLNSNL